MTAPDRSYELLWPEVLRPQEVCEVLGISLSTLYRLRRAGRFPSEVRLANRLIGWRVVDVEAWVSSRGEP